MSQGLTESEMFVASFSKRAFLKLWTHPNPIGKKGKELCDCLIVCGQHIIIISVKDIQFKDTGDVAGWNRWTKAAIEKSASQIWGAERWLDSVGDFTRSDGRVVELPPSDERIVHRVSVSLGAQRQVLTTSGDFGRGFVHVCDENSLGAVFGLLDTITDFVDFFSEVESLIARANVVFVGGGMEDLLAIYLLNNYSFPFENTDLLTIDDSIFRGFVNSDDFKSIQDTYKESYFWDHLIEHLADDLLTDGMFDYSTGEVTVNQLALVKMALQPRGHRAYLADKFTEFLKSPELKIAARVVLAYQNTAFVFHLGHSDDRESRIHELGLRCLVVRGRVPDAKVVVGLSRDPLGPSKVGYSHDIAYLDIQEWTDEFEEQVKSIQDEYGYFENAVWARKPESP